MDNSVHTKIDNSTHNTINIGKGEIIMEKLKVFISMPMDGKTKSEIDECTQQAVADIRDFIAKYGYKGKEDYDIEAFSGYVELEENPNIRNSALNYMGASLQKMAEADIVWACKGWRNARGCLFEIKAASDYGIDTFLCFSYAERGHGKFSSLRYDLNLKSSRPMWIEEVRNFTEDELEKIKQDLKQDMQTYQDKREMVRNAINTKRELIRGMDCIAQGFFDGIHPIKEEVL